MPANVYHGLKEPQLSDTKFVDASDLIRQRRIIENPVAQDFVRKAGKLVMLVYAR